MTDQKIVRKPVGNFFIKKSLQVGFITRIMIAALISVVLSAGALVLSYYLRYNTIAIYMWNQDSNDLHKKDSILDLILPALIISLVIGVALAFGIGLYASRKYAVPVYKIEQWATMLLSGKMTAVLRFREREEMNELSQKCNELGAHFRDILADIKKNVTLMREAGVKSVELNAIYEKLDKIELADDPLEIHSPIK